MFILVLFGVILVLLGVPVLIYGLFRYRYKRNWVWGLLMATAFLAAVIGVYFLVVAVTA